MSIIKLLKNQLIKYFLYFILILLLILLLQKYFFEYIDTENFKPLISDIKNILNFPIFGFLNINTSLIGIITFIFIIFLGFSIGKYYKKFIHNIRSKNSEISAGTITILSNIGYYIILTIFVLTSLKLIGIDLSNLTMIISALSVGIGFGLQTIVSNFISGIILMFEQSIKTGDFIEIGTDLKGTVVNINMRSTTIRTTDNIDIVVPNKNFVENNIINWTLGDNIVRIKIPFGVAYGTAFETVQDVILKALDNPELTYLRTEDKKPIIVMSAMGASSVDFNLYLRVQANGSNTPLVTKGVYLKLIYKTLNENNISIPFPQIDLHIKNSVPFELKTNSDK